MGLRSVLVLLLCLFGLSVSNQVLPTGPLEYQVGETAIFNTLQPISEFTAMFWSFKSGEELDSISTLTAAGETVDEKYKGRAKLEPNGTLTLSGLTAEDSGEYMINIISAGTEVGEIELRVLVPVSDVKVTSLTTTTDDVNIVTLNCTAKGTFVNYKWFNVSTPIIGDDQRITVDHDEHSGTLAFSPINRYDLAQPTHCEAYNSISKAKSDNLTLIIPYGPENVAITPKIPPDYIASQSDYSLNCSSESHPEATYTWFYGETELKTTGPTLTVKDIEKENLSKVPASYTCKATNPKTAKSETSPGVGFTIIEAVSDIALTPTMGKLIAGNSSATMNCTSTTGYQKTVAWLKNGAPMAPDARVVFSTDKSSVTIKPVQKEDNAEYTCQIFNPVSQKELKVKLVVFYGPESVALTGPTEVEVNSPVKLECSAPSLPSASYSWKFNGTKTAVTTNQYVINQAEFSNAGTYTCEAYNSETAKTSKKDIVLAVKEEGALDEGLSGGAIAGIVIGVLAAIGLAAGLFLYFRQKGEYSTPKDQNTAA